MSFICKVGQERWNRQKNLEKESNEQVPISQLQDFTTKLQQCSAVLTKEETFGENRVTDTKYTVN